MGDRTRRLDALAEQIKREKQVVLATEEMQRDEGLVVTIMHADEGTADAVEQWNELPVADSRDDGGLRVMVCHQAWLDPKIVEVTRADALRASFRTNERPRLTLMKSESRAKIFDDAGLPAKAQEIRDEEARDRGEPIGGFQFQL